MNKHSTSHKPADKPFDKVDPNSPVITVTGRDSAVVKAGTGFSGFVLEGDTPILLPAGGLEAGSDYGVMFGAVAGIDGSVPEAIKLVGDIPDSCFAGFHFAAGGNATARAGGDEIPAINPFSCWDMNFRPVCADPRGMTLVESHGRRFWVDIYLTGANCGADGTSKFGVTIADGNDCPKDASGKKFKRFDYATAASVIAAHGKELLSFEEFAAAAIGVTEKTSAGGDPETTGLDAPRTSKFGLMQATGNMWVWGHDGDPDQPRASLLGGSWWDGDGAGSRYAALGSWDDYSGGSLGARGRSDHLQLG